MKDFHAEIQRFIETHRKAGYSFSDMTKTMKKAGYPDSLIKEVFEEYEKKRLDQKKSKTIKTTINFTKLSNFLSENRKLIYSFLGVLCLVILIVLVLMFFPMKASCNNKQCFVSAANMCEKSSFIQLENTATIKYTANDCVLTKKIIKLDKTEPEEIRSLFLDQEMTCEFSKQNFDSSLVDGFAVGVDNCEGSLKDIIVEIREIS